ncbi:MAG: small subunit ribosomal protein S9 [Candidatus Midichloriaceae bacterium]|jgi:small subunit ribosomal protein S9
MTKVEIKEVSKKSNKKEVVKFYATGKRKTSIAKVWVSNGGSGNIEVNGKNYTDYFQRPVYKMIIDRPMKLLDVMSSFNVKCKVLGGGLSGQADAIKHGISKAFKDMSEEYHRLMRDNGLLTRDSRKVERKKYGQPKARKKFQFSKR